jgi:hypothetical protein
MSLSAMYAQLARNLELSSDLDRLRDGIVKLLADCPGGAKGRKQLLSIHKRNEKLRRELLGCWYETPDADAPLITGKETNVNI